MNIFWVIIIFIGVVCLTFWGGYSLNLFKDNPPKEERVEEEMIKRVITNNWEGPEKDTTLEWSKFWEEKLRECQKELMEWQNIQIEVPYDFPKIIKESGIDSANCSACVEMGELEVCRAYPHPPGQHWEVGEGWVDDIEL